MKRFISDLRRRAWRTAGARYNAARRLRRQETVSNVSLAMLSVLSIAVSVVSMVNPSATPNAWWGVLSIVLGVFLLATSLIVWKSAYGEKAGALHRNAEELTAYRIKLESVLARMDSGGVLEMSEVDVLRDDYDYIKKLCAYNHEPCDDNFFIRQHRFSDEFRLDCGCSSVGFWRSNFDAIKWFFAPLWVFFVIWLVVGLLVGFIYSGPC